MLSLLWQLFWKFPLTIMEKVKVGLYCYLIADILIKILQRCSLSSPLPNIWILSILLNLIGCHGNQKDKFAKKYSKINSPEAIRWISWNFAEMFITLAATKTVFFFLPLLMCFPCYGNLKFPWTSNKKSESRSLLLSRCRYFDRTFYKCLLSSPPPCINKLYKFLILICCHGNWRSLKLK